MFETLIGQPQSGYTYCLVSVSSTRSRRTAQCYPSPSDSADRPLNSIVVKVFKRFDLAKSPSQASGM